MSNNQSKQTATPPTPTKVIEVGKFYLIHDGSKTGHPGFIFWCDQNLNIYLAIKFGTSKNPKNIEFLHAVGNGIAQSFIYKKAFLGKRKDFSSTPFEDMIITKSDLLFIKQNIDIANPIESSNIRSKDRRNFKRLYKRKPLIQGQLSYPKVLHDSNNIQNTPKTVNKKTSK